MWTRTNGATSATKAVPIDVTVTKPFLVDMECMIWPPQMGPARRKGELENFGRQSETAAQLTDERAERESQIKQRENLRRVCARCRGGSDVEVVRCWCHDAGEADAWAGTGQPAGRSKSTFNDDRERLKGKWETHR